jgi:hypothetical protein
MAHILLNDLAQTLLQKQEALAVTIHRNRSKP